MKPSLSPLLALPPRAPFVLPFGTVAFLAQGCAPRDGASGVAVQPTLRVCVLDQTAPSTDWSWTNITLDDQTVDDQPGSPARAIVQVSSGRSYLLVTPFAPFKPRSVHTLRCSYENALTNETIPYATSFTVSSESTYTGTSPNYFERIVQQPCTQLLEVEPLRLILLELALKESVYGGAQDRARAARVLYQIAQGTDAASLLNPYGSRDEIAMASKILGRNTRLGILSALAPYERRIERALAALVEGGPVPPALAPALVDGCDSALYTHKLAAICVMPFLARAIESAA